MKLTICIPVMGQIEDTKGQWGCLVANTLNKDQVELLVINNNSLDNTTEFLKRFVFPHFPDHKLINNPENVGVLASMQQGYTESKGDIIAYLHNDLYVFDYGWNNRVMDEFEKDPRVGLAGFLGAEGAGKTGGRMNTCSNMLEAEIHGTRVESTRKVAIFDGLSLIARRTMLEQVGGFDQSYTYHHFYDRDISLASLFGGFKNLMIGISCHHRSGVTANRPEYQTWIDNKMGTANFTGDLASYKLSEQNFINKWSAKLPILIQQ
jgi:GT2 family glycosyltransferase